MNDEPLVSAHDLETAPKLLCPGCRSKFVRVSPRENTGTPRRRLGLLWCYAACLYKLSPGEFSLYLCAALKERVPAGGRHRGRVYAQAV